VRRQDEALINYCRHKIIRIEIDNLQMYLSITIHYSIPGKEKGAEGPFNLVDILYTEFQCQNLL
jgi:hypothetical protein